MLQFRLYKFLVILLITGSFSQQLMSQITYTQGFEGNTFVPAGWTLSSTNGNNLWSRRTTGTFPNCTPHSGTGMARFNSHSAIAGRTQAIITPVIDYSGLNSNVATFSLWIYRDTGVAAAADSLTISVNTAALDSGSTYIGSIARNVSINLPDTKDSSGWYQYTFNVPTSFNTNTNYIIINGTSEAGNSIYIDDVEWIAYPTQCSGTPSSGTISATSPIICGGTGATALTLSGETKGFGGISYEWQSGTSATGPWTNFDSVITTNTGTINTTTYYRCYVTCSYSGLTDTSAVYTVAVSSNTAPVVTVTPTNSNYCAGTSGDTLTASGATTYTWTPSTSLNSSTDSVVLASPATTTRYTVTGTSLNGCSATAQATVNVRPAPVITITATPDTVCAGDSVTLHASTTGFVTGATYTWLPGSITGPTVSIVPTAVTLYTVNLTSNSCPATDSVWVYANPVSVAAFGYSANGLSVTFHDSSTNATTWNWSFGDGNTSLNENPVYNYSSPGTDTVTLITTGLCNIPDTTTQVITIYALGIAEMSTNAVISVYPNPTANSAMVEFSLPETNAQLTIFNALGENITSYNLQPVHGAQFQQQIDLTKFASGVYWVRVTSAHQNFTQQLIKQ